MDDISSFFAQFGFDTQSFLVTLLAIIVGSFLLGAIGRFIFGKHSVLVGALSSAIGILFVYVLNIVLYSAGADPSRFMIPLPFLSFVEDTIILFHFSNANYLSISNQLLNMILLAFFMNLIDRWMPKGKKWILWILLRITTVLLAQAAFLLIALPAIAYLPADIQLYAPAILLGLLILMLLTGCLKFIVGLFLATINPIIAALYTFFFANIVGKMITKAVITTAILSGLVYGLGTLKISAISIALGALIAYIPFVFILIALWHFILKLFS